MSIGTWVVRSIALQQIDNAPHAKSSAEGYNKSLRSINSGSENYMEPPFLRDIPGHEKSRHFWRQVTYFGCDVLGIVDGSPEACFTSVVGHR